ncbi:serine-rich single-pass membrane protein 1 [Sorex fumeus]|uniref:serine-rich single-pass membrane protein 1 n=1 Tax=Sorex fumeus TaxID=62283 RepID=UPI0024AD7F5E|nr:serine-rich single-pass membrane protein 1 [Sorex fumeus]
MGDLFSLFWEVDPPSLPLSLPIPNQDYECQKDDSCGAIGNFLLWYFFIILVLMVFSRASVWVSERRKDEDTGSSTSVSKGSKESSQRRPNNDDACDASEMMKKSKLSQFTAVTDSEMAFVNAYLEQRRARIQTQFSQVNLTQNDRDTTQCDSEISNSGASSWKESESEHPPSPSGFKKRKLAQRRRNLGNYQIKERPCLHCKAMRTNEWLTRHFHQSASAKTQMKGDIQEENTIPDISTQLSKI